VILAVGIPVAGYTLCGCLEDVVVVVVLVLAVSLSKKLMLSDLETFL
jgi:hypothetical protein